MSVKEYYPVSRPSLNLDFANSKTVDPRITFTRASSATYFDEKGVMRTAPAGVPRIDHDPVTGECKGLLIEEQRTRLNFVSATPTVAENVTVTAVAHTVSFYGAGSIVLSGAHVATITGSGAFPTRTNLTFTPTAGTLTITPSGTVQHLQLEVGAFATSVIQGEASQVTRAADNAVMTGTNFSDWYRQDEAAFVVEYNSANSASLVASDTIGRGGTCLSDGTTSNQISIANALRRSVITKGGVTQADMTANLAVDAGTEYKFGLSYKTNSVYACRNGLSSSAEDISAEIPYVNKLLIGAGNGAGLGALNGHIKRLAYYPKRLTNGQLQALTV